QKEMASNAEAAAANPLNAVTFGAAGAAQLLRANLASILRASVGVARVTKFRRGGVPAIEPQVLRGPSHENGGIPLVAEGREIILSTGVYDDPRLRAIASAINVAAGGREFAAGGPVNPFDRSRGPVPQSGRSES